MDALSNYGRRTKFDELVYGWYEQAFLPYYYISRNVTNNMINNMFAYEMFVARERKRYWQLLEQAYVCDLLDTGE